MRSIERVLNLPDGITDRTLGSATPPEVGADVIELIRSVIKLVGEVMEHEGVGNAPRRFADLVALAYTDATDHGGKTRESHIRSLVRLLK